MSVIESAARAHRNVFIVYILFLAGTVFLSVLVWTTSNKYQDAVKADADSKIEISKAEVARANHSVAELKARGEETKLSILKMEKEVAEAQKKQVEAQRSLLELQERLKHRQLSDKQKEELTGLLKGSSKGKIIVWCLAGDVESCNFARQIGDSLTEAGWNVEAIRDSIIMGAGGPPIGIFITVNNAEHAPSRAEALYKSLLQIGVPVQIWVKDKYPQDTVELTVGVKP